MIRPDALPLHLARSQVVLESTAVHELFGARYALRGSEHVLVSRGGNAEVRIPVSLGTPTLVLDALDRDTLGEGGPLRLRGPAGSVPAPPASFVCRVLRLPAGLIGAWGLTKNQRVVVQAGDVAFGDVQVEEGEAGVWLDRADALAARLRPGDPVRWAPDLALAAPRPDAEEARSDVRRTGRLITENDVRQARLRGQYIVTGPDHVVTPAAQSLGRELGIFRSS